MRPGALLRAILSPAPTLTLARALALTLTLPLRRFGLIMLLLTDYIIAIEAATRGAPSLRFGRPLRGFLVLFIDRAVQHCIHAVRRRMHTRLCTSALGSSTACLPSWAVPLPPRPCRATPAQSHGTGLADGAGAA